MLITPLSRCWSHNIIISIILSSLILIHHATAFSIPTAKVSIKSSRCSSHQGLNISAILYNKSFRRNNIDALRKPTNLRERTKLFMSEEERSLSTISPAKEPIDLVDKKEEESKLGMTKSEETKVDNDDDNNNDEDNSMIVEILAGVVVALATVPTSIAYASIAGVDPLTGLWSSVVVGGVMAAASPGVMAGAAGVVAVPIGVLSANNGVALIPLATFIAGIIEGLFGVFKLGTLVEFVTVPAMDGLLNGFGVYLLGLQRKVLQEQPGIYIKDEHLLVDTAGAMILTAVLAGLVLPKLKENAKDISLPGMDVIENVPPTLGAIILTSVFSSLLGLNLVTLSDVVAPHTFDGGLTSLPQWPPQLPPILDMQSVTTVVSTSLSVALIGVLETLLGARLVEDAINEENLSSLKIDKKKELASNDSNKDINSDMEYDWIDNKGEINSKSSNNKATDNDSDKRNIACLGLGAGNILSATLGGFGGCGLLPQTILNIKSGGRSSISGYSYAVALVISTVVAAPLIGMIPRAAIGGLMIVVAFNTVQWGDTKRIVEAALPSLEEKENANNEIITNKNQEIADALALLVGSIICYQGEYGIGILISAIICAIGKATSEEKK